MKPLTPFAIAFGVVAVTLGGSAVAISVVISSLNANLQKEAIYAPGGLQFHTLPSKVPEDEPRWVQFGPDTRVGREEARELGTSNYLTRTYQRTQSDGDGPAQRLQLHCAYYTGMVDTVPHVPERCMVGGGMVRASATTLVPVPLDLARLVEDPDTIDDPRGGVWTSRSSVSHNRVRLPRGIENLHLRVTKFENPGGGASAYAGYFFIANGLVLASADDVRLSAFKIQARYAYYAKVQLLSTTVNSAEELALHAADLLNDLLPEIVRCVPDWTEVERGRYPRQSEQVDGREGA